MRILVMLVGIVLLVPAVARAQVSCGATIRKGERVTLTADLGPCDGVDAALVVDSGTLDLGGFTVSCTDTNADGDLPQGIVLSGRKARVTNGSVVGCSNGVGLAGSGKHRLENVTVTGSRDDGIDVAAGDKNRLAGNTASGNGSDGIYLRTDKNKLSDNVTSGNAEDGLDIPSSGDKNKVVRHRADGNGDSGIEAGGTKNTLATPTATGNAEDGIVLGGGKNKVRGGTSSGNGANGGFDIDGCAGNSVKKLTFTTASPDCQ